MRIRGNLGVLSHNRALKDASGCHQQLVGWVAMERLRQLGGLHYDSRVQVQKGHTGFRESGLYPKPDWPIKLQPAVFHELGDFPARDHAHAEYPFRAAFKKFAMSTLQAIGSGNPPDPNVGVQQDHRRASQSSLATGSRGSWYSRTEFRRARSPAGELFEITKTSTGWPASNGRPSRRSSPCSPTFDSLQCACMPPV